MNITLSFTYGLKLDLYAGVNTDFEVVDDIEAFATKVAKASKGKRTAWPKIAFLFEKGDIRKNLIKLARMPFDETGSVSAIFDILKKIKYVTPEEFGVVRNGSEIAVTRKTARVLNTFGPEYHLEYTFDSINNSVELHYSSEYSGYAPSFHFTVENVTRVVEYRTTEHGNVWVCGTPVWCDTKLVFTDERGETYYV